MEPKTKSKFEDFPPNDDLDFWGDSEVHGNLKPQRYFDDNHFFIRVSGRNAQCNDCTWGFALDVGDKVVDGHVYNKDGKIII